jgi:Tol biopolymer transport system component
VWFDRSGREIATVGAENNYTDVRLSPDGTTAAVVVPDPASGNRDIWLVDLGTGVMTRFTSHPANDWQMAWSPDGRRLAWASDRNGRSSIYMRPIDGGEETLLLQVPERGAFPKDWSNDGRLLTINLDTPGGVPTLHAIHLDGDRAPFPLGAKSANRQNEAMLTRDMKALAFASRESGTDEVYVAAFPNGSPRRVSANGGGAPRWRADDRELYYAALDGWIMSVPVKGTAPLEPGVAARLLRPCGGTPILAGSYAYDVTADGSRFLAICATPSSNPSSISVSVDWTTSLK